MKRLLAVVSFRTLLAARRYASAVYVLSVCLFVTSGCSVKTVKRVEPFLALATHPTNCVLKEFWYFKSNWSSLWNFVTNCHHETSQHTWNMPLHYLVKYLTPFWLTMSCFSFLLHPVVFYRRWRVLWHPIVVHTQLFGWQRPLSDVVTIELNWTDSLQF